MLSTLLVLGGVLAGLLALLALIVRLSARPEPARRKDAAPSGRSDAVPAPRSWVVDAGRPHPDAWSPLSTTSTSEIRAIR